MAASTADLQQWRDTLFQARLSGIREVRDSNGETMIYRSDSEMAAALLAADSAISAIGRARPVLSVRFSTSKGI